MAAEVEGIVNTQQLETADFNSQYEFVDGRIDQWYVDHNTPFTPLKIGVMGSGKFADQYVQGAIAVGHEIVFVVGPAIVDGKEPDAVRATAKNLGIPNFKFSSLTQPNAAENLSKFKPDIMIAAGLTATVPQGVAEIAPMDFWGWHPSRAKEDGYRGRSSTNWQRINELTDEKGNPAIGMCVYSLSRGDELIPKEFSVNNKPLPIGSIENDPNDTLDKGPILAEKLVTLPEDSTTVISAYNNVLMPEGVKYMLEITNKMAIAKDMGLIFRGEPQIDGDGNYQPPIEKKHVKIDLSKPAHNVKAIVDGGTFNPGAWIEDSEGNMITLYEGLVEEGESEPGLLVDIVEMDQNTGYILIGTGEGLIKVGVMRGGKMDGSKEVKEKPTPAYHFANEKGWEKNNTKFKPQI